METGKVTCNSVDENQQIRDTVNAIMEEKRKLKATCNSVDENQYFGATVNYYNENLSNNYIPNKCHNNAKSKPINGIVSVMISIILSIVVFTIYILLLFPDITSVYYVAKMPGFSAGTVKVDGYMHKNKSCCQAVANRFGAEVITVRPRQKAGVNSYGQVLKYDDAFNYCPICCY